jgi:hypothetical protein
MIEVKRKLVRKSSGVKSKGEEVIVKKRKKKEKKNGVSQLANLISCKILQEREKMTMKIDSHLFS